MLGGTVAAGLFAFTFWLQAGKPENDEPTTVSEIWQLIRTPQEHQ